MSNEALEAALAHVRSLCYTYVTFCVGLALLSLRPDAREDYRNAIAELDAIADVASYSTAERWSQRWAKAQHHCAFGESPDDFLQLTGDKNLKFHIYAGQTDAGEGGIRCVPCEVIRSEVVQVSDHSKSNGALTVGGLIVLFEEPFGQAFKLDVGAPDKLSELARQLSASGTQPLLMPEQSAKPDRPIELHIKHCTVMIGQNGFVGELKLLSDDGQEAIIHHPVVPDGTIELADVLPAMNPKVPSKPFQLAYLPRMPRDILDESIPRAKVLMHVRGNEQALMFEFFGLQIEVSLLRTLSGLLLLTFALFIRAHMKHLGENFATEENATTLRNFAWIPLFSSPLNRVFFGAIMASMPILAIVAGPVHGWHLGGKLLPPSWLEVVALILAVFAGIVGARTLVFIHALRKVLTTPGSTPAPKRDKDQ